MDLTPRQAAFVASEMEGVENSDSRLPSERREARRIRQQAESDLTEQP